MEEWKLLRNRARCRKCGAIIESKYTHDRQTCPCGAISVDGGLEYIHWEGRLEDIESLCEYEPVPSFHGEKCPGNGEHPGIECCCDECDHYLTCFPDWYPGAIWDEDTQRFV